MHFGCRKALGGMAVWAVGFATEQGVGVLLDYSFPWYYLPGEASSILPKVGSQSHGERLPGS